MKNTYYAFTKDGHTYNVAGNNRFEARLKAEIMFQVKLNGAQWAEIQKGRKVASGRV